MVASLNNAASSQGDQGKVSEVRNRVLDVLISRLGSSKTFGENMIFMLNRACTSYVSYSFITAEMFFSSFCGGSVHAVTRVEATIYFVHFESDLGVFLHK